MIDLATCLQILALIPPLQFGTPAAAPAAPPEGTGTLLIAGCRPGEGVTILPGPFAGVASQDGTARIVVPAQALDAGSYQVSTQSGRTPIHGTIRDQELLSGTCP